MKLTTDLSNTEHFEKDMQKAFENYLDERGINYVSEYPIYNRIADFLIIRSNQFINVEAKCYDFGKMISQMKDHAKYCRYCFAYIPNIAPTPKDFKMKLAKNGFGLIVYDYFSGNIIEALEAHLNDTSRMLSRRDRKRITGEVWQMIKREKEKKRYKQARMFE